VANITRVSRVLNHGDVSPRIPDSSHRFAGSVTLP